MTKIPTIHCRINKGLVQAGQLGWLILCIKYFAQLDDLALSRVQGFETSAWVVFRRAAH